VTIAHTEVEVVGALEVERLQLLLSRQSRNQEPPLSHSTGLRLRLRHPFNPLQALILPVLHLSLVLQQPLRLLGHLPVVWAYHQPVLLLLASYSWLGDSWRSSLQLSACRFSTMSPMCYDAQMYLPHSDMSVMFCERDTPI